MRFQRHLPLFLFALPFACQSNAPAVVDVDPGQRKALIEAVSKLEGRWEGTDPSGIEIVSEFQVTAEGTAIREVMFPGSSHEMTNMYTLDGNSLVMTHYCAGGNQPRMRATAVEANTIAFKPDGVSDLKAADEQYMGAMTLALKDEDTLEQRWSALKNGVPIEGQEMICTLKRIK